MNTVRVVNSPKLWDNQIKDVYRSRRFARAYITMWVAIAIILLATSNTNHNAPTSDLPKATRSTILTAAAMDKIVSDLVGTKCRLVMVSKLLNLNPDSRGIYFGR